jgi:hypothetical protein
VTRSTCRLVLRRHVSTAESSIAGQLPPRREAACGRESDSLALILSRGKKRSFDEKDHLYE